MIAVVLYGEKKENLLESIFENNLSRFFSIWEISPQKISDNNVALHDAILLNAGAPQTAELQKGIVILKENADVRQFVANSSDLTILARSSCKKQLELLAQKKLNTLVCGLSSKDTVTFSSVSDTEAVVSLQRTTADIFGNLIEPMEIAVKSERKYDSISILMFTTTLLLLGGVSQERQGDNTLYFL